MSGGEGPSVAMHAFERATSERGAAESERFEHGDIEAAVREAQTFVRPAEDETRGGEAQSSAVASAPRDVRRARVPEVEEHPLCV